ncbi:MAG: HAMP domain-containing histidine kinase [Candidatus Obscuribacterales bacterium]|nr:HAMP domain-containing histidine kinase [Candidatus Obscuribacterales bacterium]
MKLRHQGLMLIGVPLVCQLIFVSALVAVLLGLEKAAAQESYAKQIIAKSDELRNSIGLSFMALSSMKAIGSREYKDAFEEAKVGVQKKISNLRRLGDNDPKARAIVGKYADDAEHMLTLLVQTLEAHQNRRNRKVHYSQFLTEHEFMEEVTSYLHKMMLGSASIHKAFSPIVSEFQPQAAAQRSYLRIIIAAGVLINAAVAILLALTFTSSTVARLDKLNSNINRFAVGELDLTPVDGEDEIAQIDDQFRRIATERNESEELRRSILNMVSHDMRSPLTSLHGTLLLALEHGYGEVSPKLTKVLSKCNSEIMRLIRLANDLLDAELIQTGKFELHQQTNFAETIIEQSINAVRGMAEKREIKFRTECPEGMELFCDSDRLVQVLVNLLSNAIKYAPANSVITLRATVKESDSRFEVIDTGPGISSDDRSRVFEKFEQLKQASDTQKQGKGLGLAIAKSLVERHGGTIGVDSEEGKGATFWFTVPSK